MIIKRLFSILTLLLVTHLVSAAIGDTNRVVLNENLPTDTVPYIINEEDMVDYSDSLISFPSYGVYCNWDTINTHSAKFDIKTLKDSTTNITLCDENSCGYAHPFRGNITSNFGPRKRRFHYGVDIDLETGDQVNAAFDGRVRIAKKSTSYGNVIVIRHSNGLETYYAHLSKINVSVGQDVYAGEGIGLGGNSGKSRGSHLHFEVRYLGQPINPNEIISFKEDKLISDTFSLSRKTFNYVAEVKKVAAKGGVYIVKRGDTLSAIASKYRTTTKALCQKNKLKATSTLRLGQKIRL